MAQKQQIQVTENTSQLENFNLEFEYDKTLRQVKQEMRIRTIE